MTSQLVIFRAFLFIFFVPPTLDLKKDPVNQLTKKNSGLTSVSRNGKSMVISCLWLISHLTK